MSRRLANLLVLAHGLEYGGAQVSTIELLREVKKKLRSIQVVVCRDAQSDFLEDLRSLGLPITKIPYKTVSGYPLLIPRSISDSVKEAQIVWIADEAYLAAPSIKLIKNIPIVAHLRSYALICHWWGASCGFRETCPGPCNPFHMIRCKQAWNQELQKLGLLSRERARMYQMLDYATGPFDFLKWPLRNSERVVSSIDGFISVSKATREIHQRSNASLSRKPIEVVYNLAGVSDDRSSKTPHASAKGAQPTLCYVDPTGRGSIAKGPHIYVQAVRILQAKGLISEARLIGCRNSWVERYARRLGIREKLAFYGKLPRNEVNDLIDSSSVAVVPSIWPEPFGRVALEANCLGVPVVASRIGGLPEVVLEGQTGMLATPRSPSDFAQKIEKTLEGSFPREYISQITRERFKPDVIAGKFIDFLEQFAPSISHAAD